jgi:oxygen-dependent protoporphyrinogen oxidase
VEELAAVPGGWEAAGGRFDAIVVAVEAGAAARLVAKVAPRAADALCSVRYSPLVVAHWLSPDAAFPHGFGWLSPPGSRRPLIGTLFASDLHPERCPPGFRSFASMLGGTMDPEALELDATAVRRILVDEHRALTGRDVTIDGLHLVYHPRAVAIPGPGHLARVSAALDLPPGLALAGAWCGSGAMNDAVASGFAAAARLQEALHAA